MLRIIVHLNIQRHATPRAIIRVRFVAGLPYPLCCPCQFLKLSTIVSLSSELARLKFAVFIESLYVEG